jgi:hypothetical protein
VYTEVAGVEHLQAGQFPIPSTGQHQYRGHVSAEPGTYTVTGEFEIGSTWYPITGSATLYVLGNPTGSFILPSAMANVFRPSDNPLRVSADDANEAFSRVVFKVSDSPTTYQVNRAQCDQRESGRRILCDISSANNWTGLTPGTYTGTATLYNRANNHAEITSLSFTVSDSVPVVTNFAITSMGSSTISVKADASDTDTSIKNVHFYITEPRGDGVCTGNGTSLADSVVTTGSGSTYTTTLDITTLTGDYCVNVVAENLASAHSHPQSIATAIDTTPPASPTLVSPADGATVDGTSLTNTWSDGDPSVDHYIYESYYDAAATSLRFHSEYTATSKTATNVAPATFWWRVKAVDAYGNESAWSDLWKVTVAEESAPSEPTVQTVTVQADDLTTNPAADPDAWFFYNDSTDTLDNSLGSFVTGPAGSLNLGSAQITAAANTGIILDTVGYAGTRLDDITALQYSTYRSAGDPAVMPALQFDVDDDVTDGDTSYKGRLVYEPYFTQATPDSTWLDWDALDDSAGTGTGNWWFSRAAQATDSGCSQSNPCTWNEVLTAFPNAAISGGLIFKAGTWSSDFTGNVDQLVIGVDDGVVNDTTTYDFEPVEAPDSSTTTHHHHHNSNNNDDDDGEVKGVSTTTEGMVKGASCSPLLTSYLGIGMPNPADQVSILQNFLNGELSITLPLTGFFGPMTLQAVKDFQNKYYTDILEPWVPYGLPSDHTATGYVYKTTLWKINNLACSELNIPAPQIP